MILYHVKKIFEVLTRIEKSLIVSKCYKPGMHCLIAISGGQDSMCLPLFLRSFQRKWNFTFSFIFCHHGWQKESFYCVLHSTKYCLVTKNAHFIALNPNMYSVSNDMLKKIEKITHTEKKKKNTGECAYKPNSQLTVKNFSKKFESFFLLNKNAVAKKMTNNYLSRARRIKETCCILSHNKKLLRNKPFTKKTHFSEAKARDWRFRSLYRVYSSQPQNVIITGHTATDRIETALLQLIRGTSLHGLTSFQAQKVYKKVYPRYFNYSNFYTVD